jgi:hypothetical protein
MEHGGLDFGSMGARIGAAASAQLAVEAMAVAAATGKQHKEKRHKEKKHKKHKHKKEKRQKKGERCNRSGPACRCRSACMRGICSCVRDAMQGWPAQDIALGPDQVPVMKMIRRLRPAALSLRGMLSRMATWCGSLLLQVPPIMPAQLSFS